MPSSLRNFLVTGRLGPIYCGCGLKARDVLGKYGAPDDQQKLYNPDGSIRQWRVDYQALGLTFEGDQLAKYQIYIDCDSESVGIPRFLEPEGDFPCGRRISLDEFLEYLIGENIPFRERNENEFDAIKVFTNGGVGVSVGGGAVVSLIVPCPGTECWKAMKERWRFRIGPPKPFPKKSGSN